MERQTYERRILAPDWSCVDNAVYLTHHGGHDTEIFAATLQEMLDTLQRSRV